MNILSTTIASLLPHAPILHFLLKDAEIARLLVYNGQKLLIDVVILISRLI